MPRGRSRSGTNSRCSFPVDRRKEFVISIDTAHVRSADPKPQRSYRSPAHGISNQMPTNKETAAFLRLSGKRQMWNKLAIGS